MKCLICGRENGSINGCTNPNCDPKPLSSEEKCEHDKGDYWEKIPRDGGFSTTYPKASCGIEVRFGCPFCPAEEDHVKKIMDYCVQNYEGDLSKMFESITKDRKTPTQDEPSYHDGYKDCWNNAVKPRNKEIKELRKALNRISLLDYETGSTISFNYQQAVDFIKEIREIAKSALSDGKGNSPIS